MRNKIMSLGLAVAMISCLMLMPRTSFAAPGQAGSQPSAGARAPLTDDDVIRMLQAIMASIRSGPAKFDLSPAALAALRRAGASEEILNAMAQQQRLAQASGAGGTSPTPAGAKPGQPTRKLTPQQLNALLAKLHSTNGKLRPVVTNPAAGQANAPILTALQQQRQTALVERTQSKAPTQQQQTPAYARASAARAAFSTAATPPPPSGNSMANRAATSSMQSNAVLACTTSSGPIIQTVSGQSGSGAVFTQDPAYNPFTIKGCHFGNGKGQAQLNFMNGKKLADLTIDTWTDNLITVEVPPSLTDVLDQNSITLVLFPANGPQASRPGFKFYAMRRELLLSSIPAGQVSLAPINDDSGSPVIPQYSSPYKGMSGGVDRFNAVRFVGGTDQFNFTRLKPGFVLEKYQVNTLSDAATATSSACTGFGPTTSTAYTDGNWAWRMQGNSIQVSWMEDHCHDAFNGDFSAASYGLQVWVVGPAVTPATNPWQDGTQ